MNKRLPAIISHFQKNLPAVLSMGHCIFDPVWAQKIHSSSGSELQYLIRGTVRVHTSQWSQKFKAGDVVYIPRKTPHRDEFNLSTGLETFMVHFKWEVEPQYLKLVSPRALPRLSPSARAEIARVFDHLRTWSGKGDENDRLVAQSYVLTVLLLILRDFHQGRGNLKKYSLTGSKHREWIMRQARQFLEKHYHAPVLLDDIAHAIGVSPFYLSHVFSEESDFSLFSYLTELRMNKAKALLAQGRLNVAETARAVGYQDSNYFSKVFRRHFGVAPKRTQGA